MIDEQGGPHLEIVIIAPLFPLGMVVATPGALGALEQTGESEVDYLARHASGDWGDLDKEDRDTNDQAVFHGYRLVSAYHLLDKTKIYIITEHDRSATTILLPSEY